MTPTDRVLVPLLDGKWLALSLQAFQEALAAGALVMDSPKPMAAEPEVILDVEDLSRELKLPKSCIYERARTGEIPSTRVGKHLRFRRSAVLAALGSSQGTTTV